MARLARGGIVIRLRLTRSRTNSTRIVRVSASTPRRPPPVVVIEGELCRAQEAQDGDQTVSAERARTFDEGIDYDKRIVVQLDQAADDGKPRLWLSAPVCLVVSSEEGVPVRVETEGGSEYLILVL